MEIEFETEVEIEGDEQPVWVEALVELRPRGPAYSDERGDFGPETWDVDITYSRVWIEFGVDVFDKLTPGVQKRIEADIQRRALQ